MFYFSENAVTVSHLHLSLNVSGYVYLPVDSDYESLSKKTIIANQFIFENFNGKFDYILKVSCTRKTSFTGFLRCLCTTALDWTVPNFKFFQVFQT